MVAANNLLLIPTESERRFLQPQLRGLPGDGNSCGQWTIALCGFGLIAAAARSAMLISQLRPQRVLLVGIAGALNDAARIGSAWAFDRVLADGVGVGTGSDYRSVVQMGWSHWPGSEGRGPIGDAIQLAGVSDHSVGDGAGATLLSVCAASAHARQAQQRRRSYPEAIAEDMEGFGVALACALADVPLQIVRGISNRAGERDLAQWQTESALASAATLTNRLIQHTVEETR